MSDLWPGEAEIMEQHEWRMSEAPTAEILAATREYPKPVATPPNLPLEIALERKKVLEYLATPAPTLPTNATVSVQIEDLSGVLPSYRWTLLHMTPDGSWVNCPKGNPWWDLFPMESYTVMGFAQSRERAEAKGRKAAAKWLNQQAKQDARPTVQIAV